MFNHGHMILNHQVFHINITVDGYDLNHQSGGHAQPDSPPWFIMPGKYLPMCKIEEVLTGLRSHN